MKLIVACLMVLFAAVSAGQPGVSSEAARCEPCRSCEPGAVLGDGLTRGHPRGTLIAVGGGSLTRDVIEAFIEAAGGTDAPMVYLPTALPGDLSENDDDTYGVVRVLRARGCTDVTVVHTRDQAEADSGEFAARIRRAGGVWFSGGRQWRFVDSYMDTAACEAFHEVLDRGGVIAGSSAGATIQASYLVRGAPQGNQIMMAPGYEQGFAFLENAAIDQHLFARGRERDLVPVIERHPHLLGIGIDESGAVLVRGGSLRVIGGADVAIYTAESILHDPPYVRLEPGSEYDLLERMPIDGE